VLQIGANDIGFGSIVALCVAVPDCPNVHVRWVQGPSGATIQLGGASPLTLKDVVASRLAELRQTLFPQLAGALSAHGVAADRVYLVEYFDPAVGDNHTFCDLPFKKVAGISPAEAQWAATDVVTPLNNVLLAAASANGWHYVGGVQSSYEGRSDGIGHGACAADRWVVTFADSLARQATLAGSLHPNFKGQRFLADLLGPRLLLDLYPDGNPRQ
jgi:hypothetical protein